MATLIARTIEPRSIYDARLSDAQVRDRQRAHDRAMEESPDMTDEPEMPRNVSDEGTASFWHGLPRDDCPYPPGSEDRAEWLSGWDQAAARAA
jgi:ribosome modulation factor